MDRTAGLARDDREPERSGGRAALFRARKRRAEPISRRPAKPAETPLCPEPRTLSSVALGTPCSATCRFCPSSDYAVS